MKLAYVAVLLAVLNVASVRAADELEAVELKMKALWDGFTSMSYDSDTKADNTTEQFAYKMDSVGTIEMAKAGEKKWKMRSDSKTVTVQKVAGQPEMKTESTTLLVSDGDTMYTYTESQGVKNATKMKVPPQQADSGDSFIRGMREYYNLKLLPDETVEGMACWAIEAKAKNPAQAAAGTMKYCISKDHGVMVLMEMKDPAGKVSSLTKVKNVKVNPSIAADRFVFTAPAGVTVVDVDAQRAQGEAAAAAAQAQAAEAQKKAEEAQKKEEPAKTETTAAKEEPAKTEPAKKEEEPKKKEEKKDTKTKIKKGFGF